MHVACFWMCVLIYFSFVFLHVCAYAYNVKVHCGSALGPGASRLPWKRPVRGHCILVMCDHAVLEGLAVWRQNTHKKKTQ